MSEQHFVTRYRSDSFSVGDFECRAPRKSASAAEESTGAAEVIFVRRGAFVARRGKSESLASPQRVLFLSPDRPYVAEHPIDGGDSCTVVSLHGVDLEEYLASFGIKRHTTADPFAQGELISSNEAFLLHHQMRRAATNDDDTADELLWELLDTLLADWSGAEPSVHALGPSSRRRRIVRATEDLIHAHHDETLPLSLLADEAGVSPFYLTRLFRQCTGLPLHRYITRLRLRLAFHDVTSKKLDLTTIALDHGFSHHSHFTNAFRAEFGVAPSNVREG